MAHGDWKDIFKAVEANDLALVEFYLRQGVDVNYQHPEYFTNPFFESIRLGHIDITRLLLAQGASLQENEIMTGLTPLELAKQLGNAEMLELVKAYL
jgi:ankyrin repeat protein